MDNEYLIQWTTNEGIVKETQIPKSEVRFELDDLRSLILEDLVIHMTIVKL